MSFFKEDKTEIVTKAENRKECLGTIANSNLEKLLKDKVGENYVSFRATSTSIDIRIHHSKFKVYYSENMICIKQYKKSLPFKKIAKIETSYVVHEIKNAILSKCNLEIEQNKKPFTDKMIRFANSNLLKNNIKALTTTMYNVRYREVSNVLTITIDGTVYRILKCIENDYSAQIYKEGKGIQYTFNLKETTPAKLSQIIKMIHEKGDTEMAMFRYNLKPLLLINFNVKLKLSILIVCVLGLYNVLYDII
jgi:hypothetical protein